MFRQTPSNYRSRATIFFTHLIHLIEQQIDKHIFDLSHAVPNQHRHRDFQVPFYLLPTDSNTTPIHSTLFLVHNSHQLIASEIMWRVAYAVDCHINEKIWFHCVDAMLSDVEKNWTPMPPNSSVQSRTFLVCSWVRDERIIHKIVTCRFRSADHMKHIFQIRSIAYN